MVAFTSLMIHFVFNCPFWLFIYYLSCFSVYISALESGYISGWALCKCAIIILLFCYSLGSRGDILASISGTICMAKFVLWSVVTATCKHYLCYQAVESPFSKVQFLDRKYGRGNQGRAAWGPVCLGRPHSSFTTQEGYTQGFCRRWWVLQWAKYKYQSLSRLGMIISKVTAKYLDELLLHIVKYTCK